MPLSVDRGGVATAVDGGFLVIGMPRSVRDVIDTEAGEEDAGSLADDPNATAARDALPDKRLADAYLSEDGIAELVAGGIGAGLLPVPMAARYVAEGTMQVLAAEPRVENGLLATAYRIGVDDPKVLAVTRTIARVMQAIDYVEA